jgi:hypothetical protein
MSGLARSLWRSPTGLVAALLWGGGDIQKFCIWYPTIHKFGDCTAKIQLSAAYVKLPKQPYFSAVTGASFA